MTIKHATSGIPMTLIKNINRILKSQGFVPAVISIDYSAPRYKSKVWPDRTGMTFDLWDLQDNEIERVHRMLDKAGIIADVGATSIFVDFSKQRKAKP